MNEYDLATKDSDDLLYHYTTQAGLIGILRDKCLWATNSRYLNDTSEGQVVTGVIVDRFSERAGPSPSDILEQGLNIGIWATSQNMFVTSFSEKGNSLSQWRAYSGQTGGYSIGFRRDYLGKIANQYQERQRDKFYRDSKSLARCIYLDQKEAESLVQDIDDRIAAFLREVEFSQQKPAEEDIEGFTSPSAIAMKYFLPVGRRAAITKHESFHEEAEWRMAFLLMQNAIPPGLNFRPGSSMPVPYLKIDLLGDGLLIGMDKIFVGPCPHPREAVNAVDMLVKNSGIKGVQVVWSGIPYRNW